MGALCFPTIFSSLMFYLSLLLSEFSPCKGSSPDVRDFVTTRASECHFVNGTQRVRLLDRLFYNQEEFVYFDSEVGKFVAKTEFGRPDAEYWNNNPDFMAEMRSAVERYCIYNYGWMQGIGATERKVQPSIKISLMDQYEQAHTDQHMLLCNVFGFYPSEIEVKWYRNGQEETEQVQFTDPYHNGDWTYQILVMLETEIQKGDTFTCEVHHCSLEAPHRVDWHPQTSDADKSKMATGICGFVLGTVFLIAGIVMYLKGKKGQTSFRGAQSENFLPVSS